MKASHSWANGEIQASSFHQHLKRLWLEHQFHPRNLSFLAIDQATSDFDKVSPPRVDQIRLILFTLPPGPVCRIGWLRSRGAVRCWGSRPGGRWCAPPTCPPARPPRVGELLERCRGLVDLQVEALQQRPRDAAPVSEDRLLWTGAMASRALTGRLHS